MTAHSNSDIAYKQLYQAIQSGALAPGDRIVESDIAKMTGLSRTPVRDAIKRLETDGIIEHQPHIGAVVKTLSHQEIVELYEMRIVLEQTAASMAAKHASKAEIKELKDLNQSMMAPENDAKDVAKLNFYFHRCIFNAARNRYLFSSYRNLSNAVLVLGSTTIENEKRVQIVCDEHDLIIKALELGDADAARLAAGNHIETSLSYRLKNLRL